MRNPIHIRAVQRAADIAGGQASLARYLEVSPLLIAAWILGAADVPAAAFLRIVDIVIDHEGARQPGAIPAREAEIFRHREAANS